MILPPIALTNLSRVQTIPIKFPCVQLNVAGVSHNPVNRFGVKPAGQSGASTQSPRPPPVSIPPSGQVSIVGVIPGIPITTGGCVHALN